MACRSGTTRTCTRGLTIGGGVDGTRSPLRDSLRCHGDADQHRQASRSSEVTGAPLDPLEEVMTAAQRAFIAAPDTEVRERAGWFQIITPSSGRGGLNEVSRSILGENEADAIIDATLAEYRGRGIRFRWRLDDTSRPLDLGARLER